MKKNKHKKLSDKEIADLKKTIAETKETFEDSHLGEKKVTLDQMKDLEERVRRDNSNEFIRMPMDPQALSTFRGLWHSSGTLIVDPYNTPVVGGFIRDDNRIIICRVNTAIIHNDSSPIGSGITVERTIEAEVDTMGYEIDRNYLYNFEFNGGERRYSCRVQITNTHLDENGYKAYMKVIGALNIT